MRPSLSQTKGPIAVVFVIALFVLIAFALISLTQKSSLPKEGSKENVTRDLCARFTTEQGEISCEEAKNTALAKYPGQILFVNKALRLYVSENTPKAEKKMVWIIQIKPKDMPPFAGLKDPTAKSQAIDTIGVAVALNERRVLFVGPYFKK